MANNALVTVDNLIQNANVRKRFTDVFGNVNAANNFMQSMVSLTNGNAMLRKCSPQSILSACMVAATLKLPINPSLGFAYVVPYGNAGQFQIGYRGLIQLAMRTGQYQRINVANVHEGEIKSIDFVTGDIERGEKKSDKVVGYIAYFRLINGFEKTLYMSREEVEEHATKFSKTYRNKSGVWHTHFDRMAQKTVLKLLISRFGIMSTDMQSADLDLALRADQAVVKNSETMEMEYVDNQPDDVIDADTPDSPQEGTGEPIEAKTTSSTPPTDKDAQNGSDEAERANFLVKVAKEAEGKGFSNEVLSLAVEFKYHKQGKDLTMDEAKEFAGNYESIIGEMLAQEDDAILEAGLAESAEKVGLDEG